MVSRALARQEDPIADFVAFRAHPGLPLAIGEYCAAMVAPASRPFVRKFLNHHIRHCLAAHTVACHGARLVARERATVGLLQRLGWMSARQTAQVVAIMRRLGLVTTERDTADPRRLFLLPTRPLLQEIARHSLAVVAMLDRLDGGVTAPLFAENDDLIARLFAAAAAVTLPTRGISLDDFPTIAEYAPLDGGFLLMTAVIGAHLATKLQDAPPVAPLALALLPDRLQVSRSQVAALLRRAERGGHFQLRRGTLAYISEAVVAEYSSFLVANLLHFGHIARRVLAEHQGAPS